MDLDKPFSDDSTIVGRTFSVACHESNSRDPRSEYSPPVPHNYVASANHIAMLKGEQSSLNAKQSISPRAFDQTGPITVTGPSPILSPSGGRAMDTDMDRISITSLAPSSISGFASLRSLARRIRMDRITTASSEDQSMNDVPSSVMQWDTSSENSLPDTTSQMRWKPEAQSTIEEGDGYTAKFKRKGILPRLQSAFQRYIQCT
jgi:hypothetical protein